MLYLFHGQEFQKRKNQMPVQKMCYLGCQIVVRHLGWLQNPTLLTNTEQTEPRNATSFHFLLHYVYIILFLEKITVKI